MIATAVAVVLVAVCAGAAPVPPALRGIDTVPARAAVAGLPTAGLIAIVVDDAAAPVHRARAARLLGSRNDHDDRDASDVDAVLAALRASPVAELRVQAALAQGDRARSRGDLVPFASALLADDDIGVRGAAITLLWRARTTEARRALASHVDVDAGLRRRIAGRLRRWTPHIPDPAATGAGNRAR